MIYSCCNERRRAAVLGNPTLNGIDYLEVLDSEEIALSNPLERQKTLLVHCLNPVPGNLVSSNVLISGGESITGITALWISTALAPPAPNLTTAQEVTYFTTLPDAAKVLVVRTSAAGDFSPYLFRLVNNASQAAEDQFQITEALAGFDPQLASVQFSFKVECGPEFDCKPQPPGCPPPDLGPPPINYLAKDYGSFRSILLDRLNQLVPSWGGASEADIGVALAELIAYAGDYLSYQQDAVATEAYIETARSRVSLRRHARLVDYFVHDGCNARAWVQLAVSMQVVLDQKTTRFYTFAPGMPANLKPGSGNEEAALQAGTIVFEPMQSAILYPEHNRISFYTWGDTNCCLPKGATEATLRGTLSRLQPGDVLIFEEVLGPQTGFPADADLRHRCAVRLTQVTTQNSQGQLLVDPLFENGTGKPVTSAAQQPTPITEVQWSSADALRFPVCISSTFADSNGDEQTLTDVSVVLGNIVLADQGLSFSNVPLGTVPQPTLFKPPDPAQHRCNPSLPSAFPVRFRPAVPDSPLTQAVPLPISGSPVTPGIVSLRSNGYVSLNDAEGHTSMTVEPDDAVGWPQYFAIAANQNATHAANFDLHVQYTPPGGPTGVTPPVNLETLADLSLNIADLNYAPAQINTYSKFIQVPSSYVPGASPTTFPANPIPLTNSGQVSLLDGHGAPYLTVQAVNPPSWPPNFGVRAQGNLLSPSTFNLLVVYNPPSGGVGVPAPVLVEQFNNLSLDTVTQSIASASELIKVQMFDQQPDPGLSAFDLMNYDASEAMPVITLTGVVENNSTTWTPEADLLESGPADTNFVAEVESSGVARLRFGDNTNGEFPPSNTVFTASYRIGNGSSGNVGAGSLIFLAGDPRILSCANPLPATGGIDPETEDQIRRRAPQAFMTQERAIVMPDYAAIAERNPQVKQAVANLRWTGSWYTVFIAAEPEGGGNLTPALSKALTRLINRYRLAGEDIQLESPEYLPLAITLVVCVDPEYFQSDVRQSLLQVLGCQPLPNGQDGLFDPNTFAFGQTVYLSPIYAAVRKVPGVTSVTATAFGPQGTPTKIYLNQGEIPLGPLQIARMDNDPSYPNHGQLKLVMKGGK